MFGLGFQEILVIALIMNEVTNLEEVKKEEPEKKDE